MFERVFQRALGWVLYVQLLWPGASNAFAQDQIHDISLYHGHSETVRVPWQFKRASVTNPDVADIEILSPDSILLLGKAIGSTDLIVWSASDETWRARISVVADLRALQTALQKLFVDAALTLTQSGETVVVSGQLARAHQVDSLQRFLESSELKYVNMTSLAGVQQVQIKVRVAEVSRVAIRNLTMNALRAGDDLFGALATGSASGGALNPINMGLPEGAPVAKNLPFVFTEDVNVSPLVTLFGGSRENDLAVFLQALSENQYLRMLAEPTLVALSGEKASFLAGGEFPIPVVQGGTAGGTSISIEYKEFGVRLTFRPTVLGENSIRLYVAPETSELTAAGSVEIEGFSIPGVTTRRAETTLEMKSGQTFAMAGLLASKRDARNSRIPFLGDIPILGSLFRSVRYTRGETELLVIVTSSLVEPLSSAGSLPLPGSFEEDLNDWEIFLGRDVGKPKLSRWSPPIELDALGLGRLRGPGAWQTHTRRSRTFTPRSPDPTSAILPSTPSTDSGE